MSASPWSSRQDAEGRTYYVHRDSGESSWEKPAGFVEATGAAGSSVAATSATSAAAPASSSPWSERVDAASGKTYYYHTATHETTWERPPGMMLGAASAGEWAARSDPTTGRPYFFNVATREVAWELPAGGVLQGGEAVAAAVAAAAAAAATIASTVKRTGWESHVSSGGRTYFVNLETGKSQWEPPPAGVRVSAKGAENRVPQAPKPLLGAAVVAERAVHRSATPPPPRRAGSPPSHPPPAARGRSALPPPSSSSTPPPPAVRGATPPPAAAMPPPPAATTPPPPAAGTPPPPAAGMPPPAGMPPRAAAATPPPPAASTPPPPAAGTPPPPAAGALAGGPPGLPRAPSPHVGKPGTPPGTPPPPAMTPKPGNPANKARAVPPDSTGAVAHSAQKGSGVAAGGAGGAARMVSPDVGKDGFLPLTRPRGAPAIGALNMSDLKKVSVLGAGALGRVTLVRKKSEGKTGRLYALKSMSKAHLGSLGRAMMMSAAIERDVLHACDSDFIVRMRGSAQDRDSLHVLLDASMGGELFDRIRGKTAVPSRKGKLPLDEARFYLCCVILGLEHLHERGVVYRDIKAENCLIDDQGYVKLADMGFCKRVCDGKTHTQRGTMEYLAPEVVTSEASLGGRSSATSTGHGLEADAWSAGVLLFEMLAGYTPFRDASGRGNDATIQNSITKKRPVMNERWSATTVDFIDGLLDKSPATRLGSRSSEGNNGEGISALFRHAFFTGSGEDPGLDVSAVRARTAKAPWVPPLKKPEDTSCFAPEAAHAAVGVAPKKVAKFKGDNRMWANF